jgi:Tfp pilus assembly protein FimT
MGHPAALIDLPSNRVERFWNESNDILDSKSLNAVFASNRREDGTAGKRRRYRKLPGPNPDSYHKRFGRNARERGVGLVEIVLVLTIILTIAAVAIPKFIQIWYSTQLRSSAAEISDLLQQARIGAARANATYPVRYQINGGLQQAYIDLNNNGSLDSNEPSLILTKSITGASGAPSGSGGQPTAFTLVGDTSSGSPFDNSNTIAYSPRGLPCNYIASTSTCATPAASYFVFYFEDSRDNMWSAVLVTKSGRTKVLMWNGASWE